ncbi:MAG: hypothetical protein PVG65_01590 [Candidatus Thorarchaeota archaeon]
MISDIQDEEIPTGERYEAIVKLWKVECDKKPQSAITADWCKGLGIAIRTLRNALDYVGFKEEEPELAKD